MFSIQPLSPILFHAELDLGIHQFENMIDRLPGEKVSISYEYYFARATQVSNEYSGSRALPAYSDEIVH